MKKRERKTPRKTPRKVPVLPLAIAGGVVVLLALIFVLGKLGPNLTEEINRGHEYLESLEQKDPADVQKVRKAIRQAELEAQRDELLAQLEAGEIDPCSLFQDYVLMGDSRSVGFEFWNYLDSNRVLADSGATILSVDEKLDTLESLNPSTIYMCFGLNDVSIGIWPTAEEYAANYMEVIDSIKERLPDVTIVVSSILPAKDPAFYQSTAWYSIPDWNVVLEEVCEEHDIIFANCDEIAEEYFDLWDPDGIHFQTTFYPHWSRVLVTAALSDDAYLEEEMEES